MNTGGEHDEAARALADIDAVRRRVINVVGHALRTPVTTIAGMARALEDTTDDETRDALIAGLSRNARRIEHLLDDLLVAAGVSTALPVGAPTSIEVHEAVRDAWRALDMPGSPPAVTGPDLRVVARPESLARILAIVLDNALKYGDGSVAVVNVDRAGSAHIEISSAAEGPTDEELAHAFELLYRGEHAVMTAPGLGVGLAVARALAHADGGDMALERRGALVVTTLDLPAP